MESALLANYPCAWDLPRNVVDMPGVTSLKKTDCPSPYCWGMASWLGWAHAENLSDLSLCKSWEFMWASVLLCLEDGISWESPTKSGPYNLFTSCSMDISEPLGEECDRDFAFTAEHSQVSRLSTLPSGRPLVLTTNCKKFIWCGLEGPLITEVWCLVKIFLFPVFFLPSCGGFCPGDLWICPASSKMTSENARNGQPSPKFQATVVTPDGWFKDRRLTQKKMCKFLFYPLDFTFVRLVEIIALGDRVD